MVSKNFMDKRGGGGGREGVSRFSFTNFLSHSAKKFRREPIRVSLSSVIEKFYA